MLHNFGVYLLNNSRWCEWNLGQFQWECGQFCIRFVIHTVVFVWWWLVTVGLFARMHCVILCVTLLLIISFNVCSYLIYLDYRSYVSGMPMEKVVQRSFAGRLLQEKLVEKLVPHHHARRCKESDPPFRGGRPHWQRFTMLCGIYAYMRQSVPVRREHDRDQCLRKGYRRRSVPARRDKNDRDQCLREGSERQSVPARRDKNDCNQCLRKRWRSDKSTHGSPVPHNSFSFLTQFCPDSLKPLNPNLPLDLFTLVPFTGYHFWPAKPAAFIGGSFHGRLPAKPAAFIGNEDNGEEERGKGGTRVLQKVGLDCQLCQTGFVKRMVQSIELKSRQNRTKLEEIPSRSSEEHKCSTRDASVGGECCQPSRGSDEHECSTQAASMGGVRSHFVSNIRKFARLIALCACFSNPYWTAICLTHPGCSSYRDDVGGPVPFSSRSSSCGRQVAGGRVDELGSSNFRDHCPPYPFFEHQAHVH